MIRILLALCLLIPFTTSFAADAPAEVPPGEIAGVVTDDNDQPIEGATIDAWSWYPGSETKSDKNGKFHLKKLSRDDPVEIRISKPGFSPWYNEVQPTGVNDLNVTLTSKTYFEGTVLAPDGKPVASALVRADCGPKRNPSVHITTVWTETRTDKEGKYKLFVWPDRYEIQVRVPKVGVARLANNTIGQDEAKPLDIQLDEGITFRAVTVDADTGEPVAHVRLILEDGKGLEGKSDKDGNLTITGMLSGKASFDVKHGLYARWWSEQATESHQRKETSGEFHRNFDSLSFQVEAMTEPAKIELEKAVIITGVVRDPDGNPVAGATVDPARTGTGNSLSGDTRFSTATKKDGTFTLKIPASHDSQYNLAAHDGKYRQWRKWANGILDPIQTKPGDKIENVVITLSRPGGVKGRLTDSSDNPIAHREIRAVAADKMENRYYDPTTRTDEDGKFELKFLRPGEHYVQSAPFWLNPNDAASESSVNITVQAGETKEGIELKPPPERRRFP